MLKQIIISTTSALAVFAVTTISLMAQPISSTSDALVDIDPYMEDCSSLIEDSESEQIFTSDSYIPEDNMEYLNYRLPLIYDEPVYLEENDNDIVVEELGIDDGVYPTCPFLQAEDTNRVVWYTGNMKLCHNETSSTDYNWNEEDLEWLAKIIHCEICDQGAEARHAVGTVIMNRVEWNECPDTILGVISQTNQFSPWKSGIIFDAVPCEYCYEAAYDVLANGYRAFPREVRYFQSIEDGFFDNLLTYAYFTEAGFDTWFCFNLEDVENPDIEK